MNPLTQKLLDASESLATPMHSTNQASQHTPLPRLHRIHQDFGLMNSDTKELFPVTYSVLDELCRRSNSHAELLAALEMALAVFTGDNQMSTWAHYDAAIKIRAVIARATQS